MENNNFVPQFKPEDMACFAVVCDNELVSYIHLPKMDERHIAIYSSNPTFIQVPVDQLPPIGAVWNGERFELEDWE